MALKIKLKPRKEQQIPDPTATHNTENEGQQALSPSPQHQAQRPNSAHLNSEEDTKEGALKRKHPPSPTSSSASKRMCRDDSSASGESRAAAGPPSSSAGLPPEVLSGRCEQVSAEPLVVRQRLGSQHVSIAALLERENQSRPEDEDSRTSRVWSPPLALENISHGQLQVISVVPSSLPGSRISISNQDNTGQVDSANRASADIAVSQQVYPFASWARPDPQPLKSPNVAVIPAHASWFSWDRIHKLERQAMPQFFFGKSKLQSPETFMQARNAMIMRYRSNPQKPLGVLDVRDVGSLGDKELGLMLDFFIQWGLINYQADSAPETAGFRYPTSVPVYLTEDSSGLLSVPELSLTSLQYLYHFEVLRVPSSALKSLAIMEEPCSIATEMAVKEASGTALSCSSINTCSACASSCSTNTYYYCEKQADYLLCRDCYSNGNLGIGMVTSDFVLFHGQPEQTDSFDLGSWTDQETLMLLEALEIHGDNWTEVSEFVGTKSKAQCISHFIGLSIEDRFFEDMEVPSSFTTVNIQRMDLHSLDEPAVKGIDLEAKLPLGLDKPEEVMESTNQDWLQSEADMYIAFEGASNPVMSLVAFLAATVGPRVAAAAAHTALLSLSEDYQAARLASNARDQTMPGELRPNDLAEGTHESQKNTEESADGHQCPLSKDSYRKITSAALATGAMKTKLLADQEEREVQRLAAIIVDNQLKKLSMKLKQLGDIDAVLEKEREQMERKRQLFQAERSRFLNARLSSSGSIPQLTGGGIRGPGMRPAGPVAAPPAMPSGAVFPSGPLMPSAPAMTPGTMIASNAVLPPHMLRPALFTIGPGGKAMPVSSPMVKPPS